MLNEVLAALNEETQVVRVRVEGHADDSGPENWNMVLSRRRATMVARWLVRQGIPRKRLDVYGCGELHLLTPDTSDAGRVQNRRVEFHVAEPPREEAPNLEGCQKLAY